jgi:hypothetical protein
MRNQLFHANLFPDLSKVTLRRVFKTDQGWVMEADGQDLLFLLVANPFHARAIAAIGVL